MDLGCRLFGHGEPAAKPVWNEGYFFSTCSRCRADIIRGGMSNRWRSVPPGHRVSWRARTESDIRW